MSRRQRITSLGQRLHRHAIHSPSATTVAHRHATRAWLAIVWLSCWPAVTDTVTGDDCRWSVGEHLGQLAKSPLWTPHKMGPKSTLWTPPKSGPKSTLPTPPKIGGPGSPPAPPARPRKFPGAGAAARARRRPPKIRQNRGSGRYLAKGAKTGVLGAKINGFHRDLGGSGQGAQAPRTAQIRGGVFRPGFPGSGKCHILLGI